MLRGACCILLTVGLFWPVAARVLARITVSPEEQLRLASQFIYPADCRPEPGERSAYLLGLVLLPALNFGLVWSARTINHRIDVYLPRPVRWLVEIMLGAAFAYALWRSVRAEDYFHLSRNLFFLHPRTSCWVSALSLVGLCWMRLSARWLHHGVNLLVAALIALVVAANVFDEKAAYATHIHFIPVYNAMVQVQQGKAVLIELVSQYGLYPHFLRPFFAIVSLNVITFTATLGALTGLAMTLLWFVLRDLVQRPLIAALGFLALLFNCWFFFLAVSSPTTHEYLNMYFQYFPIRFLFPVLAVFLVWRYASRPSRALYGAAMAMLSSGVFWNLDSGLPTFGTWIAALCYGEFFQSGWRLRARGMAKHVTLGALAMIGVAAAYALAIKLQFGSWPHVREFIAYQKTFYVSGFFMLPMPFPGTWLGVALVYLAGFAYAADAAANGRDTTRARVVLALSMLGSGLFAYYQGRSHAIVLTVAWWPCFPLLAIFLDELLDCLRERTARPMAWLAAAMVVWILVGSSASVITHVGVVARSTRTNLRLALKRGPSPVAAEAALLKREVPRGHEVIVWSEWEPVLHRAARRTTAARSSLVEMVVLADYRRLRETMAARPDLLVFVDNTVLNQQTWPWNNAGVQSVLGLLRERYQVIGTTARGSLFRRRDDPIVGWLHPLP